MELLLIFVLYREQSYWRLFTSHDTWFCFIFINNKPYFFQTSTDTDFLLLVTDKTIFTYDSNSITRDKFTFLIYLSSMSLFVEAWAIFE